MALALSHRPTGRDQSGQDGLRLLSQRWGEQTPPALRALPDGERLRNTWMQPFFWHEGVLRLHTTEDVPPM